MFAGSDGKGSVGKGGEIRAKEEGVLMLCSPGVIVKVV
jgi:hypothetical protein